ncbi:arsenate reductase (glutaredoxin) [Oceanomicrobium pacificus]|uniref:Arsenate reductase n=1 Tax=Oceanomicrobium pacificus TaxID=2692916 RepID=A0A6B0TVY5_9RHOB|nr:arsenate reductase (glutaredoxin) [Oceanomicrobium pacificus]MXU65392.1 arsenate reductase (glutaredoxin) [Oceanomicrobium pacificus]
MTTIWHNPRCSKSRQTLALLAEHGITPEIRLYLQDPPDAAELATVLSLLGIEAGALLRKGEQAARDRGLTPDSPPAEIIAAMVEEPKLIERPIVVKGDRAVLGRPPEAVLALFD